MAINIRKTKLQWVVRNLTPVQIKSLTRSWRFNEPIRKNKRIHFQRSYFVSIFVSLNCAADVQMIYSSS